VVVPVARREENLKRLVERCRPHSPASGYLAGDLGERTFAEAVVEETIARHGRLDVLVNNAALPKHKHLFHCTPDDVERVMAVNFSACVWTIFAALPHMLRQGSGALVNVSSIAGRVAPPRESLYGASKAALSVFTQGLWNDLEGSGVHASLVVAGAIDTEIWSKLDEPAGFRGRKASPQVVADAIVDAVLRRRYEVVVPRSQLGLHVASLLRLVAPGLLRFGMRRMEPVPASLVEEARDAARRRIDSVSGRKD